MAHFSRFLPRGSVRVGAANGGAPSNVTKGLQFTAAVTPANELVVVVLNPDNKDSAKYQLQIGKGTYVVVPKLPQNGIQTIVVPLGKEDAQAPREPAAFAKVEDVFAADAPDASCSHIGKCGRAYQACCAAFAAKGFPCQCHLTNGTGESGKCGDCGTGYSACCIGFKAKGYPCECDVE